jgi:putative ABC transport system permease protein
MATLLRQRSRTTLAVAGVTVAAAMLLDMVELGSGMRVSFQELLLSRGYQLRIAPKGTLPLDTDATIGNATGIVNALRADPDIIAVSPVLGASVHAIRGDRAIAAAALGMVSELQGDFELLSGKAPETADEFVADSGFMAAARIRIGDAVSLATGYDPQLRTYTGRRDLKLVGTGRFLYTPASQKVIALPLSTLQEMGGAARADRISFAMIRGREGADLERVRERIEREHPRVTAISIATALEQVEQRLSYFRQLAVILASVSLIVGFLLVSTLLTVSVNERVGEIVVMRAIGTPRVRIVMQIIVEGVAISTVGALLGLMLGAVTARYLDSILSAFPGLPAGVHFFVFQPKDAWTALGLLTACGIVAGIYPAWRAASLPIATTLRQEAIA